MWGKHCQANLVTILRLVNTLSIHWMRGGDCRGCVKFKLLGTDHMQMQVRLSRRFSTKIWVAVSDSVLCLLCSWYQLHFFLFSVKEKRVTIVQARPAHPLRWMPASCHCWTNESTPPIGSGARASEYCTWLSVWLMQRSVSMHDTVRKQDATDSYFIANFEGCKLTEKQPLHCPACITEPIPSVHCLLTLRLLIAAPNPSLYI